MNIGVAAEFAVAAMGDLFRQARRDDTVLDDLATDQSACRGRLLCDGRRGSGQPSRPAVRGPAGVCVAV